MPPEAIEKLYNNSLIKYLENSLYKKIEELIIENNIITEKITAIIEKIDIQSREGGNL